MTADSIRITVLFEDPFWVGILEKTTREGYSVAKTIFGFESTNNDVYYYLLKRFDELFFSKPQFDGQKNIGETNPKRRQREAQKELQNSRLVSKAHDAIKLMFEQAKISNKIKSKLIREEESNRKYMIKQGEKKKKHKGH